MQPGDIFLVNGQGKFSSLLVTAQKAFYGNANSSHVLVNLAEGIFVHATSDGGVDVVFYDEILENINDGWRRK